MSYDQFKMLSLRSAGRDGAAHEAQAPDGTTVEMRILSGARADPGRWIVLRRQIRLAALLDHPAALHIRELGLDQEPPYLVVDSSAQNNLAKQYWRAPASLSEALALAGQLAEVLASAHHLGLAHGRLRPSEVFLSPESTIALDFTGTLTGTAASSADFAELDRACQAPEPQGSEALAPARDQFALGVIFFWLAHGEIFGPGPKPRPKEATTPESATSITSILETLALELVKPDPSDRPGSNWVMSPTSCQYESSVQPASGHPDCLGPRRLQTG